MDTREQEVSIIEKLRSVDKDYLIAIEIQWNDYGKATGHRFIPVGRIIHEAADALEAKDAEIAALKTKCNAEYDRYLAIVAAKDAEIAALKAELEKAKDIPMKYKRMEFNAQLQQEVERLETELGRLQDAWQFIADTNKKLTEELEAYRNREPVGTVGLSAPVIGTAVWANKAETYDIPPRPEVMLFKSLPLGTPLFTAPEGVKK